MSDDEHKALRDALKAGEATEHVPGAFSWAVDDAVESVANDIDPDGEDEDEAIVGWPIAATPSAVGALLADYDRLAAGLPSEDQETQR